MVTKKHLRVYPTDEAAWVAMNEFATETGCAIGHGVMGMSVLVNNERFLFRSVVYEEDAWPLAGLEFATIKYAAGMVLPVQTVLWLQSLIRTPRKENNV